MGQSSFVRWSGLSLAAGGIVNAVFVVANGEHLYGVDTVLHGHWGLAHGAHFYAAVLLLIGVVGFYLRQASESGAFGAISFTIALVGAALFTGGGLVTAYIWPVLAANAPALVEGTGPFFSPPLPIIGISIATFALGFLLMGIVTVRAGVLPRTAGWLLTAGSLVLALPPRPIGPVPGVVLAGGSMLFAIGAVWIGFTIWSGATAKDSRESFAGATRATT